MVSTHLKNIGQYGNLPQLGMKLINIWNHHLGNIFSNNAFFGVPKGGGISWLFGSRPAALKPASNKTSTPPWGHGRWQQPTTTTMRTRTNKPTNQQTNKIKRSKIKDQTKRARNIKQQEQERKEPENSPVSPVFLLHWFVVLLESFHQNWETWHLLIYSTSIPWHFI